jgi:hypothetical protein
MGDDEARHVELSPRDGQDEGLRLVDRERDVPAVEQAEDARCSPREPLAAIHRECLRARECISAAAFSAIARHASSPNTVLWDRQAADASLKRGRYVAKPPRKGYPWR